MTPVSRTARCICGISFTSLAPEAVAAQLMANARLEYHLNMAGRGKLHAVAMSARKPAP